MVGLVKVKRDYVIPPLDIAVAAHYAGDGWTSRCKRLTTR